MPRRPGAFESRQMTLLLGIAAAALVTYIILYPDRAFQSSLSGLSVWWNSVFPALLPFFILSEMMAGLGLLHALGTLLHPVMRIAFRLPGAGGWALAMGTICGYPAGAAAASQLSRKGLLDGDELERTAAAAHLCNPMVMVGVVGAGFLHDAAAGLVIAIVHYVAAAAVFMPGGRRLAGRTSSARKSGGREGLPASTLSSMRQAREADGRTFGKLLGDAVTSSVQAMMAVGGLIIMFSVCLQAAVSLLPPAAARLELIRPLLAGLLEVHLGAFAVSGGALTPVWAAAVIGALLAWGGLAVHAQTSALLHGTGARYASFIRARLLHAAAAFALTFALWQPLYAWAASSAPRAAHVFLPLAGAAPDTAAISLWPSVGRLAALLAGGVALLALFALAVDRIGSRRRVGR